MGQSDAALRQPVGMAWRATGLDRPLPLRFEKSLRLKANQQGIQRTGFDIGAPGQIVSVGPVATGIEQFGQNVPGAGGKRAGASHPA